MGRRGRLRVTSLEARAEARANTNTEAGYDFDKRRASTKLPRSDVEADATSSTLLVPRVHATARGQSLHTVTHEGIEASSSFMEPMSARASRSMELVLLAAPKAMANVDLGLCASDASSVVA